MRKGCPGGGGRSRTRRRTETGTRRCSSIDRLPARWESRLARSRRPCGRRLPASTSETGSIRRERPRDVTIRLAPESRTVVADLESLPLLVGSDNDKSIPLGQVARVTPIHWSGAYRSPRSRSRDQRRSQHGKPRAIGGGRRHHGPRAAGCDLPPGYTLTQGVRPRNSRRSSRRCSLRSAWRSC